MERGVRWKSHAPCEWGEKFEIFIISGTYLSIYNWFLSHAQSLVLLAIVVIGLYLGFKREFSKLIGFLIISLIAVGLVFNAAGVKDILLELFNKIIGA